MSYLNTIYLTLEHQQVQAAESAKSEEKQSSGASDADNSSFSSLLSIESVGVETSLLQECISSAMPTPKLPISSSCRGIGGGITKVTTNSVPQAEVGYTIPPPPSATAPITTPVSPHSSQSPSPLAVSEIAPNALQKGQDDQQHQIKPPQSSLNQPQQQQQLATPNTGLRRARHFLAHGSGTADDQPLPTPPPAISRAPDHQKSSNNTMNTSSCLAQPSRLKTPAATSLSGGQLRAPRATAVSGLDKGVARVLKAPHSMSGNASPANTRLPAPAASKSATETPTAGRFLASLIRTML